MKQNYIYIILSFYLLKVYGFLALNKYGLISDLTWCNLHYIGNSFLLCGFLYLLKDKVNSFIYSLGMAIFVSRLFTELFNSGLEYWYEMLSVITITTIIYSIKKICQ